MRLWMTIQNPVTPRDRHLDEVRSMTPASPAHFLRIKSLTGVSNALRRGCRCRPESMTCNGDGHREDPTMTRRAVVTLAAVALGAGVFVSGGKAAPSICGSKNCADEVAAGCPGLSGKDLDNCKTSVLNQCKLGVCSCTGDPALPACGPTTTSTTTTA